MRAAEEAARIATTLPKLTASFLPHADGFSPVKRPLNARRQPTAGYNFEKYLLFREHLVKECPGTRRLAPTSLHDIERKIQPDRAQLK